MNKTKKIPEFKSEAEERHFWENTDSSDYLDWSQSTDRLLAKAETLHQNHIAPAAGNLTGPHQD